MQLKSDVSANIIQESGCLAAKDPFCLHFNGLKNSVQKYVFINNFVNNFDKFSIFFFCQKKLKG